MCEKNARLDVLIFCRRCPQPPNVQCCCELGGGSGGCEINARFCKAHALKLTATLNIGGRGGSARKRQERPSGRFFRTYRNRNFAWCIARKNVKTTDSHCESECVNDGCLSVRPSVRPSHHVASRLVTALPDSWSVLPSHHVASSLVPALPDS